MNQEFKSIISGIKYRFGVTQGEIAKRLGVTPQYLSDVVNDRAPFNDSLKTKIEEAFRYEENTYPNRSQSDDFHSVPLLPVSAQAGRLSDFSESVAEYECDKIISPVKDAEIAVPIIGESMYPEFPSGAIVFVKKINEKAFIEWGKTYVLDTVNGLVIKHLAPGSSEKYVKCLSSNPNPMYAPFEIPLSEVFGIYRIVNMLCTK